MARIGNGNAIVMLDDCELDRMVARLVYQRVALENEWREFATPAEFFVYLAEVMLAAEPPPALILLDLNLPGVSGLEVLSRMHAVDAFDEPPPVVILTGAESPEAHRRAFARGADAFVVKPDELERYAELFERLGDLVATGRRGRASRLDTCVLRQDILA